MRLSTFLVWQWWWEAIQSRKIIYILSVYTWLITFEPLELIQSYIFHLKVLVGGINAPSSRWCGCIFIMCYSRLKFALLLHKTVLVNFQIGTTLFKRCYSYMFGARSPRQWHYFGSKYPYFILYRVVWWGLWNFIVRQVNFNSFLYSFVSCKKTWCGLVKNLTFSVFEVNL